jgi:hypothetical protein
VSVLVRVVLLGFDGRGHVVGRVDRAHETVDPEHENRGQETRDEGPGRPEQA